jgi:putative membrane protein
MRLFLAHWFVTAVAVAVSARILPGVGVRSWPALLLGALVLGLLNASLRPILVLLTLPLTIVTLGLFYFVVNGISFSLAAAVVPGFDVATFGWAILGALVTSIVSWFLGVVGGRSDWRT